MEQIADKALPPGTGYEWTAMSYQEKLVGNQIYYIFALAMLLVYLVLAGQYESWFMPVSVHARGAAVAARAGRGAQGPAASTTISTPRSARPADCAVGQERDPDRRSRARAARVRGKPIWRRRSRRRARASVRS